MNLKGEKGITIVALIIMIIVMLILVAVGVEFGMESVDKAKLEDIKTDMLSIKAKAKIVVEQYNYKEIDGLVGTQITNEDANKINVNISSDAENFRKWSSYDIDNPNNCEVYYLKGYNGKYSLSELQEL